jgi:circadian clock protein KaiC
MSSESVSDHFGSLTPMTKQVLGPEMVPTGVVGLDYVLLGGIVRGGFYLIQGDPGAGKTTIALQYVIGCVARGERCLYVSLTETEVDLRNACKAHGWDLEGIDLCDLTIATANHVAEPDGSIFHPADTELSEITRAVIDDVERVKPQHVVFDGLSELRLMSGDALRYRRQLLSLKQFFADRGVTVLLLDDRTAQFQNVQPETLVGGSIVLDRMLPEYGRARRRLYVTKVRGWHFREGYHDYEVENGGVVVHPRLVAADHHACFDGELHPSGISNLDKMLHGGLSKGTTTLLLGPSGAGKSTVAIQFVVNALKKGQKAAVYSFDEIVGTLIGRSEKLCLGEPGGMASFTEKGLLHVQQVDAAELSPGAFAHEVRRAVDAGAGVIVIDSLNGYMNAMPEERYLATHLHELFTYLNQKGVITIIVATQHGMLATAGPSGGVLDISYLADSVLLLRYFESKGEILQAISVFKKRTGPHERTIRQLKISTSGIEVGNPLSAFRGVMTGVPQYEGQLNLGGGPKSELL